MMEYKERDTCGASELISPCFNKICIITRPSDQDQDTCIQDIINCSDLDKNKTESILIAHRDDKYRIQCGEESPPRCEVCYCQCQSQQLSDFQRHQEQEHRQCRVVIPEEHNLSTRGFGKATSGSRSRSICKSTCLSSLKVCAFSCSLAILLPLMLTAAAYGLTRHYCFTGTPVSRQAGQSENRLGSNNLQSHDFLYNRKHLATLSLTLKREAKRKRKAVIIERYIDFQI